MLSSWVALDLRRLDGPTTKGNECCFGLVNSRIFHMLSDGRGLENEDEYNSKCSPTDQNFKVGGDG
jgi:hypothetical protein